MTTGSEGFSASVLRRAEKYADHATPDGEVPDLWWVRPSSGEGRPYRVALFRDGEGGEYGEDRVTYWVCTCEHGRNNPGRSSCWHVATVARALTERSGQG